MSDPWLGTVTYTRNEYGQVLTTTDRMGGVTTNTYDASGNIKTVTDALGKVTTIEYPTTNNKGLPDSIKDARLNVTKFKWFPTGLLQETEDAYLKKTSYTYDARGRIKTVANALNDVTTYNYFDDAQRKVETIYPNSDKVTYKYDVRRLLESVTDGRGNLTSYEFDTAYRLKKITDPLGHAKEFDYDLMSNMKWTKDALGNQTNYLYDDFNRLKELQYPLAATGATRLVEKFEYDKAGRIKKHYDTANRLTEYGYDDVNRTNTITDALMKVTRTKYNQRFQTIEVKDALNQIYNFTYDPFGRVLTQTRAGTTITYEYDEVGNRKKRTDYLGRITDYTYDNLNRLTNIAYQGATDFAVYGYDDLSRLTSATNQNGAVSFSYDKRNRIKTSTDVFAHTIEYGYDENGNRNLLKLDGAIHAGYIYDAANRLTHLTDEANQNFVFGYDEANNLKTKTLPNNVVTTYNYDGMSRLKQLKHQSPTATLFDNQFAYNAANQIDYIVEPAQMRDFDYDNVNRLTNLVYAQSLGGSPSVNAPTYLPNESYAYDGVGNRTSSHQSGTYGYQPNNKLTSTATATYSYDANGNLISKSDATGSWTYAWDYENRMTGATNAVSGSMLYAYDALGRRIKQTQGRQITKFTYDGQDVVMDDLGKSNFTKYQNGLGIDDKLKMITTGGAASYFLSDHLGSTVGMTDSVGTQTSSASYESFGKSEGNMTTRYRFTGREYDSFTGLYYYRARWYDANLGRFVSEDPIGFAGAM
jgi:RHS repeat-associated protein